MSEQLISEKNKLSSESTLSIAPTKVTERYLSLDLIRGIAVFGILIMNIQSFGNVFASYFNPTVNGDFQGINQMTWFITHIFFDQKFYTIFSMLFGAGILLMAQRAQSKGVSPDKFHYRRSILLIIFGLCHAFFLWYGDILMIYGFFALFAFFAWKKTPKWQLIVGLTLIMFMALFMLAGYYTIPEEDVIKMQKSYLPDIQTVTQTVNGYRGDWAEAFSQRLESLKMMAEFFIFAGFRIGGGMLVGMALFRLGILNAQKSQSFYLKLTLLCLLPGLALVTWGAILLNNSGFIDAKSAQLYLALFNYVGSMLVAVGYIGLFNLFYLSERGLWLKQKLQAVGQMAFTNYIAQSVLCTTLFYGFGFGLFGELSRFELILVALTILFLQLFWSDFWLNKFKFGPLEWLWRTLTYCKWQPFIRR